jgi:hypothetical protein
MPHIDFDIHIYSDSVATSSRTDLMDLHDIVDTQSHVSMCSESSNPLNLAYTYHLIGNENVFNADLYKRLGLACFLYTDP